MNYPGNINIIYKMQRSYKNATQSKKNDQVFKSS